MNTTKAKASALALLITAAGTLGLAACSSDDSAEAGAGDTAATAASCDALTTDLETAKQAVVDALADDDWAQVMLASDVDAPTVKYGLMVMPFVKTDAAERVTGTVTIEDGANYVIEAEDADGLVCQIDQDGTISEVTE